MQMFDELPEEHREAYRKAYIDLGIGAGGLGYIAAYSVAVVRAHREHWSSWDHAAVIWECLDELETRWASQVTLAFNSAGEPAIPEAYRFVERHELVVRKKPRDYLNLLLNGLFQLEAHVGDPARLGTGVWPR